MVLQDSTWEGQPRGRPEEEGRGGDKAGKGQEEKDVSVRRCFR